jgi:hypothetical protein
MVVEGAKLRGKIMNLREMRTLEEESTVLLEATIPSLASPFQ